MSTNTNKKFINSRKLFTMKLTPEERTAYDELAETHGFGTLAGLIRACLDAAMKDPSILDPTADTSLRRVSGEEFELLSAVNSSTEILQSLVENGRQRVERRLKAILSGDVPTFMELPHARSKEDLKSADVAFLGIPWEGLKYPDPWTILPETASPAPPNSIYYRTGADKSPEAIRKYSIFYSFNHGYGFFPELSRDFIIFNHLKGVDYGDVEVDITQPSTSLKKCLEKVSDIYEAGAIPLVSGGDHAIPYPCVQALAKYTEGNIGIITFDSHFDLYFEPEFSAASQWGRLFDLLPQVDPKNYCSIGIRGLRNQLHESYVAEELGIQYYTMVDIETHGIISVINKALDHVGTDIEALYVSLDIDVVDPAFCPAQKYPEPAGLTSREIISALRQIGKNCLINGFDICCLGPQYDTPTGLSAQLCARLFMEVMATIAWQKKIRKQGSSGAG